MKKIVALLLVFVMVFALAACGGNQAAEEPAETEGEGEDEAGGVCDEPSRQH